MDITRWNPLPELEENQRRMQQMLKEGASCLEGSTHDGGDWLPNVGLFETDSDLVIEIDVPGVDESRISLKIEGALLTVQGERIEENRATATICHRNERTYGNFIRSFMLSDTLNPEAMQVTCDLGVLKISLPKI